MQDIKNNLKFVISHAPVNVKVTGNTTGVDLQGFDGGALMFDIGDNGDTFSGSVKFDLVIQDSDDDATYTDVTANTSVTGGTVDSSGIFQTIDADAECEAVYGIGYVGGKRYIRGRIIGTGTHSTGTIVGATVIKGIPLHAPVTSDANA